MSKKNIFGSKEIAGKTKNDPPPVGQDPTQTGENAIGSEGKTSQPPGPIQEDDQNPIQEDDQNPILEDEIDTSSVKASPVVFEVQYKYKGGRHGQVQRVTASSEQEAFDLVMSRGVDENRHVSSLESADYVETEDTRK